MQPGYNENPDWNVINMTSADIDHFRKRWAWRRFVFTTSLNKRVKLFPKQMAWRRFVSATVGSCKYARLLIDLRVQCRAAELRCRQAEIGTANRRARTYKQQLDDFANQSSLEAEIRLCTTKLELFKVKAQTHVLCIASTEAIYKKAAEHMRIVTDLEAIEIQENKTARFLDARAVRMVAETRVTHAEIQLFALQKRAKAMSETEDSTIERHVAEMQRMDLNHEREQRKLKRDMLSVERLHVSHELDKLSQEALGQ
jgi:hypothetical protein